MEASHIPVKEELSRLPSLNSSTRTSPRQNDTEEKQQQHDVLQTPSLSSESVEETVKSSFLPPLISARQNTKMTAFVDSEKVIDERKDGKAASQHTGEYFSHSSDQDQDGPDLESREEQIDKETHAGDSRNDSQLMTECTNESPLATNNSAAPSDVIVE